MNGQNYFNQFAQQFFCEVIRVEIFRCQLFLNYGSYSLLVGFTCIFFHRNIQGQSKEFCCTFFGIMLDFRVSLLLLSLASPFSFYSPSTSFLRPSISLPFCLSHFFPFHSPAFSCLHCFLSSFTTLPFSSRNNSCGRVSHRQPQ